MRYRAEYRDSNGPRYFADTVLSNARGWCFNILSNAKNGESITIWIDGRIDRRAGIVKRDNSRAIYEDCMDPKEHRVYRLKRNGELDIQIGKRIMSTGRYEKLDLSDVLGKPTVHI